jgi:membrane fusion protein, copper/silver efflux system
MKNILKVFLLLVALIAVFILGSWQATRNSQDSAPSQGRKILYWVDPMHPAYKSDKPGIAPDCGMQLEPVYADGGSGADTGKGSLPPGSVQISPEKQQIIGMRVEQAEITKGVHNIRILGRVAPDQTRIYVINAALDGWIVDANPNTVGSLVQKDEILAYFYSPELLGSQQAYIFALNAMDRYQSAGNETSSQIKLTSANIQQYKDTLKNQGMSDRQIEEIRQNRLLTQKIYMVSPAQGFVLVRNVFRGLRFERGAELYRIADLSHVWILADIFENEEKLFRPGATAKISHAASGKSFEARVSSVLPQFDPTTRTLKVRLDVNNPGYMLRPDMFVDVEFPRQIEPTLTVPSEAILNTGLKKLVFVDRGNGYFEPRRIETGWRMSGRVQVTKGLTEGERVVVSGNFLVDSESQMQLAAAGLPNDYEVDPVCGMGVDPNKPNVKKSQRNGRTYYFCSDLCKADFDKNPEKYSQQSAAGGRQESRREQSPADNAQKMGSKSPAKSAKDLVCGMDVDISMPGVLKADYRGKTYYFCSELCKKSFQNNPAKYVRNTSETKATHDMTMDGMSE